VPAELNFRELLSAHLSGDELCRLVRYAELVEKWSAVHNLVRYKSRRELVERHLLDALAAHELMGDRGKLLDVGSGAGLPGVPLLAVRPGWRGVLLEPRHKRWAFLRQVVRELGLEAEVVASRYQQWSGGESAFDVITARAVGGLDELLEWAQGRLAEGGRLLLWGTEDDQEALRGRGGWRVLSSPLPSLARGRLLQLSRCFT
jgi:16S rRNA (guanine527-N7)-methyltransferase